MKLNRRSFFGMAAGAAAAGPSLAKMAAENAAAPGYLPGLGYADKIKGGLGIFDKAKRVMELQDIVAGKTPRQPRHRPEYDVTDARIRIDGLRSVSLGYKYEMLQEVQAARQHRSWLENCKGELAHLLGLGD